MGKKKLNAHMSLRPNWLELILVSLAWSMPRSIATPPPGRDACPSQGYPLAVLYMHVTGTHLYTLVKRDKSSLLKEPTGRARLEPQTYRSEFEVLMT